MAKTWYFTFGCNQAHENCYHKITAADSQEARTLMFQRFDDKWSMQYDSAEEAGVERFNLTEIK